MSSPGDWLYQMLPPSDARILAFPDGKFVLVDASTDVTTWKCFRDIQPISSEVLVCRLCGDAGGEPLGSSKELPAIIQGKRSSLLVVEDIRLEEPIEVRAAAMRVLRYPHPWRVMQPFEIEWGGWDAVNWQVLRARAAGYIGLSAKRKRALPYVNDMKLIREPVDDVEDLAREMRR